MKAKSSEVKELTGKVKDLTKIVVDTSTKYAGLVKEADVHSHFEYLVDLLERSHSAGVPVQRGLSEAYSNLTDHVTRSSDLDKMEGAASMLEKAGISVEEHLEKLYSNVINVLRSELVIDTEGSEQEIAKRRIDLVHKIDVYEGKLGDISKTIMEKEEQVAGPEYFPSESAVARYLGIKQATFNQWTRQGRVKLSKTEVGGKLVYMRSDVDQVRSMIVTYPGGDPRLYDKPVFDLDWVVEHYGISQEHLQSIKVRGLLKHSDAITRKSKEGNKVKSVKQYVYTESDLQRFEKNILQDPSIGEQYKLNVRAIDIVPGANGHQDARYGTVKLANGSEVKRELRWIGQHNGK